MSGGGGEKTSTTVQSQSSAPWSGQQEFLKQGFEKAESDVLNRPLNYFPDSTVTPFSNQTTQALQGIEGRALEGGQLTPAAQADTLKTLQGGYLDQGNPAFQGMVNRAVAPMQSQYENVTRPGIMSAFTAAGRGGSNIARAQVETDAANDYMGRVGDVTASLAYPTYEAERGRMMGAAGMAPGLDQADYADFGQLANVGSQYEAMDQASLQDRINRFNFAQSEPTNRLGQYMGLIGGGYGGSSTASSVTPVQGGNSVLGALGAGSMGVGIANGLFGPYGLFG